MRIGILTFHAAHNYGAVLQCYSLQEYLKSLGHEVYVIDYQNDRMLAVYKRFRVERILRKNPIHMVNSLFNEISLFRRRKKRHSAFHKFIAEKLNLTSVETIERLPFDIIFIGSDQVWSYS